MSADTSAAQASRDALVQLVRPCLDGEPLLTCDPASVDWPWVIERARAQKVAALVAARLEALELVPALPAAVQAGLAEIREAARLRAQRAKDTLRAVVGAIGARDIPVLLLKGRVFADDLYRDPTRRPFFDVDVVVPDARLADAEAALVSIGYRFNHGMTVRRAIGWGVSLEGPLDDRLSDDRVRPILRRVHHQYGFAPPDDRWLHVDLHWRLRRPGLMRQDPEGAWAHTRDAVIDDMPVQVLAPESMLLHAAAHAMDDGFRTFRLLHLVDVAWILARHASVLSPTRVWALASAWGVRGDLGCALQAVHEVLGVGSGTLLEYERHHGPGWRALFRRATHTADLLQPRGEAMGVRAVAEGLAGTALWELATRRPPRHAVGEVRNRLRLRWRVLREAVSS